MCWLCSAACLCLTEHNAHPVLHLAQGSWARAGLSAAQPEWQRPQCPSHSCTSTEADQQSIMCRSHRRPRPDASDAAHGLVPWEHSIIGGGASRVTTRESQTRVHRGPLQHHASRRLAALLWLIIAASMLQATSPGCSFEWTPQFAQLLGIVVCEPCCKSCCQAALQTGQQSSLPLWDCTGRGLVLHVGAPFAIVVAQLCRPPGQTVRS